MKLVSIDDLKTAYREALVNNLIDERRGIDWSEYAEEPSNFFNKFIDDLPVTDVLREIREEIRQEQEGYPPSTDEYKTIAKVLRIIDKHIRKEPEPVYRQDNKYRKNNHQNFKKEDGAKKGGPND